MDAWHYELTYIVPIKYLEGDFQKAMAKVNGLVKEFKGEITIETILGKQRLAYPINAVHQGTYVAVEFNMAGAQAAKLGERLKLMPEVLRFLIVKKKERTVEELKREQQIQERLRKEKEKELAQMEAETKRGIKRAEMAPLMTEKLVEVKVKEDAETSANKKKASLEDLDKKLDEILTDDII